MLEAPLEQDAVDEAERRGWEVRKIVYLGRRSAPDRWFFKGGRLLIVEFKKLGKVPTTQQQREHRRLAAAGFPVHHIDTFSDFLVLLGRTEREIAHNDGGRS